MALLPIQLAVAGPAQGRRVDADLRKQVVTRDKGTCQFCGFRSSRFQTIRLTQPQAPARADSYVTACPFCDQCFELEQVAFAGSGILIWLPEIGQAALHHVARAIYVARAEGGEMGDAARVALDALMVRRYEARRRLGTDDPLALATVLLDHLRDVSPAEVASRMDGIRLLPTDKRMARRKGTETNTFDEMLSHWRSPKGPFAKLPVDAWADRLTELSQTVGNAQ